MSKKPRDKSKPDAWMPLYIGDFLAGTTSLSTELKGAYLLLLMAMWKQGARILNDDTQLAATTGLSLRKWLTAKAQILPYLKVEGKYLTQKRLLAEYEHAWSVYEKRVNSGKQGGRPRIVDLFEETERDTERLPERGAVRGAQSQSQSQSEDSPTNDASGKNAKGLISGRARDQSAIQACKALAAAGVEVSNLDPHLLAALDAGIPGATLVALANSAKGRGKGIAYLSKTAIGQQQDAVATTAPASAAPVPVKTDEQKAREAEIQKHEDAIYDARHLCDTSKLIDAAERDRRIGEAKTALRALHEATA